MEVAARRAVMTGITQLSGEIALDTADMLGTTLMEITAHIGARPSHAQWQGKIVDLAGEDARYLTPADIGYGEGGGFKGWNCRHDWHPFVEGISQRVYTDAQLATLDPPPFTYEGKEYTAYEATQVQRKLKTAIRQSKRRLIASEAAEDEEGYVVAAVRLRQQRQAYTRFSEAARLPGQDFRTYTYGFGRRQAAKARAAAEKEIERYSRYHHNKDGTILVTDDWKNRGKVTIPKQFKPFAVVETKTAYKNGVEQIDRTLYNAVGQMSLQIHSGGHNKNHLHQYGENGETCHAHDYCWKADGTLAERTDRPITTQEQKEHQDILKGGQTNGKT